ncbi:hypothetical protein PAAG_11773 [Paracoccidioides lutzii Pb01]|uniref:Uncharacterized protein n=1 Tax=Paracoccidioides lutzii (strain ATCC MYA-826 / Pb01) TaxID=502779 RepID=A0A0A2V150_PARBA|nr:hypothetical protein PAAG_11773 [Paracoccidioides lutzii Pb01]KGQ01536.1 hypothetical protein PAAG_11773 [Paracoccidioides lutzii Pb01]
MDQRWYAITGQYLNNGFSGEEFKMEVLNFELSFLMSFLSFFRFGSFSTGTCTSRPVSRVVETNDMVVFVQTPINGFAKVGIDMLAGYRWAASGGQQIVKTKLGKYAGIT